MRYWLIGLAAFVAYGTASAADTSRTLWHDTRARTLSADAPPLSAYRPLLLDLDGARTLLAQARHGAAVVAFALPHPDGSFSDFALSDSRTLPDTLQDKFPDIVSLAGKDAQGRMTRVDISPQGLQAMVFDADGIWVVRPESLSSGTRYLSFRRADLTVPSQSFQCEVHGGATSATQNLLPAAPMTATGATQRVYRAAVAANHNYVAAVCPSDTTVACGLANVVTAMNRVNQVYETELGVHMTLIGNDDAIIYPNASGDPYSNDGSALDENITNLDNVIGDANFDIGHVFTTGSGGVAELGVTCTSGDKAGGTTGLSNPTGDAFYIDYVAHEMGHQFGGNHTFNSNTGSCGGGNREAGAAYEPGSGSTIMAYAGICGADNLQSHSDPYFHAKSLQEINTWINAAGGSCAASTASPDQAPVIDTASIANGLTIPMQTPFALTASASDADGDALSYNWEQYDLGSATKLTQGDIGTGPIFRSFNATTSGTRIFPKIETVLGAAFVPGETWPKTTRNLDFRLTVRDNHDVPGTPQFGASASADTVIHVTNTAGPFVVTAPATAASWQAFTRQNVTWNVANTTAAPVSCANVDVLYSADGGQTFATALANGIPNSGTATLTLPNLPQTSSARIEVRCSDNIFFNVSPGDFSLSNDRIFADGFGE